MTLTQQWRYLKSTGRNSIYILFLAKDIKQIVYSRLYVRLKGTCLLDNRAFVNKLHR